MFRNMSVESFGGFVPQLKAPAFVAPSADVIGRVVLSLGSSVWYHATLRGDLDAIEVGEGSNVQDHCCLHVETGGACRIGRYVTIGHGAVLHACTVEDSVLIGMGAVVLDGAIVGFGSIVGARALVTKNTVIPPFSLVLGVPAKVVKKLPESTAEANRNHAEEYVRLAARYGER